MSWPDVTFTQHEKEKFKQMAEVLEKRIAADSGAYEDLARFAEYQPFAEALALAKKKEISKPMVIPNTNYWYFETDLPKWMKDEGTGLLSGFLLAIKGFPYDEAHIADK
jgi:hypothetical protein